MKSKRFLFHISVEVHQQLKIMAARKNVSMALYLTKALLKQLQEDSKYDKC